MILSSYNQRKIRSCIIYTKIHLVPFGTLSLEKWCKETICLTENITAYKETNAKLYLWHHFLKVFGIPGKILGSRLNFKKAWWLFFQQISPRNFWFGKKWFSYPIVTPCFGHFHKKQLRMAYLEPILHTLWWL